uniref:Uncharacterized protein n=1 Tax=Arabidopsis thaliana TaxID=3702 RepID=Q56W77_ARATH|nr:hypothetical protein [Arabidopsis thaliana]
MQHQIGSWYLPRRLPPMCLCWRVALDLFRDFRSLSFADL